MVTSFVELKCQFLKGATAVIAATITFFAVLPLHAHTKKISWNDFQQVLATSSSDRQIQESTPVSFVVDTKCAAEKIKHLRPGGLLNGVLARGAKLVRVGEEQTIGVQLTTSVSFALVESEVAHEDCIKMAGLDGNVEIAQAWPAPRAIDPERSRQVHLDYLHFEEGLSIIKPVLMIRKPVTIAIIDAGVDMSHRDLASGVWRNTKEIPGNGRDDDRNGFVDDVIGYNFGSDIGDPSPQVDGLEGMHGTHVAGLAAARWRNGIGGAGVGGIAKIMAINVFGNHKSTKSSIVENAIRYAARNGADVINMSLSGGEYSRTMISALQYAISRGSFIVAATGNSGLKFEASPDSGVFFSPAAYGAELSGMVSVASVDTTTSAVSTFSNYNSSIVQIAAPGAVTSYGEPVGLWSSFPRNHYGVLAGTSMSAPLVSGAAALIVAYLKACGMTSTPSRVENILINGSPTNAALVSYVNSGRELNLLSLAQYLNSIKAGRCL